MISVATAKQIIHEHTTIGATVDLPILHTVGYALSKDVLSPIQFPAFRQSSMDGYAIKWNERELPLTIQDILPAGTAKAEVLQPGFAIQVFTGGPIPDAADCVVQKEWVEVKDSGIHIHNTPSINPGDHIRAIGSDIQKDSILLSAGTLLHPAHIGLLASVGITKVQVIQKPSVGILITGNEILLPNVPLQFGKVYDANAYTIQAHLQKIGISFIEVRYAADNLSNTEEAIAALLAQYDLLIITGGVSVGDFDFVPTACKNIGIKEHFHKVKQRPGKPLYFGTKNSKLVFGLPGNPAAVLSCMYQYVIPAIDIIAGTKSIITQNALLTAPFHKTIPFTQFLKGYTNNNEVTVLPAQASYQLSAISKANCWIELAEESSLLAAQDPVKIYHLL